MTVESVTQAVSNLALEFGDDDAREGAMVGTSTSKEISYLEQGTYSTVSLLIIIINFCSS